VTDFPLPGAGDPVVAVPAPGAGPGYWAGAPHAALDEDGAFVIGYRVRNGHDGNDQTIVARSADGEHLTTVAMLDETEFDAQGMERPAVVRTESGRWRLYVCSATRDSPHWWIDVLEADDPEGFARPSPAPSSPATITPESRTPSCSAWTEDGERGSAAICSTSPAKRIV
jgi:hypothetical protein